MRPLLVCAALALVAGPARADSVEVLGWTPDGKQFAYAFTSQRRCDANDSILYRHDANLRPQRIVFVDDLVSAKSRCFIVADECRAPHPKPACGDLDGYNRWRAKTRTLDPQARRKTKGLKISCAVDGGGTARPTNVGCDFDVDADTVEPVFVLRSDGGTVRRPIKGGGAKRYSSSTYPAPDGKHVAVSLAADEHVGVLVLTTSGEGGIVRFTASPPADGG